MREIKFRAWDKARKSMLTYRDTEATSINFGGKIGVWRGIEDGFEEEPHLIPMQYTGLKDKNGKEIYEGDIVKIGNLNKQVFMRLGCWFAEMGKELGYYGSENIEVIGNIYENPELLGS